MFCVFVFCVGHSGYTMRGEWGGGRGWVVFFVVFFVFFIVIFLFYFVCFVFVVFSFRFYFSLVLLFFGFTFL